MKVVVFKFTVDGISSYDDKYHDYIHELVNDFRSSDRAKWLGQHGFKLTLERFNYDSGYKYEHRYVTTIMDSLLTEYLLLFSSEPMEA